MRGVLGSLFHELPPLSFLSILRRKFFGKSREKTHEPHNLFSFLFTQPNILQKSFLFHFFSKVFHPSYFTSKQIQFKIKN